MRWPYQIGVSLAVLVMSWLGSHEDCYADDMQPQTHREMHAANREMRSANITNKVSPKVSAMARADTLDYKYYQASIAEKSELKQRIHSQPRHGLFTRMAPVHQQIKKDYTVARSYPVEWFCYIKGNGPAIWDHRP